MLSMSPSYTFAFPLPYANKPLLIFLPLKEVLILKSSGSLLVNVWRNCLKVMLNTTKEFDLDTFIVL